MAKQREGVCPGCSKHCSCENVRCKYGKKYFEKQQRATVDCIKKEKRVKRCKWEKYVEQGSLLWKFLRIGYRSKKALRSRTLTEYELLAVLDDAEKAQLDKLLAKMAGAIDKAPVSDKERK